METDATASMQRLKSRDVPQKYTPKTFDLHLPQKIAQTMSRYSDITAFGEVFGPSMCGIVLSNEDRAIMSEKSPRIIDLSAYSKSAPLVWMKAQFFSLNIDAGDGRMTPKEIDATSRSLIAEYAGLRVTDFLLFFAKLRAGHYGKFYGSVDGISIATSFQKFVRWLNERRADIIARRDLEAVRLEEELHARRAVSRPDFEKMVSSGFSIESCQKCNSRNCVECKMKYLNK